MPSLSSLELWQGGSVRFQNRCPGQLLPPIRTGPRLRGRQDGLRR